MNHILTIYTAGHKPVFWRSSKDGWKLFQIGGRMQRRHGYRYYYRVSSYL